MKTIAFLTPIVAFVAIGCSSDTSTAGITQPETPKVAQAGGSDSTAVTGQQGTASVESAEAKPIDSDGTEAPKTDAAPESQPKPQASAGDRTRPAEGGIRAEQPGGQGGGRQRGGRGSNLGFLVRSDQMKTELKLTDDQIKKLEAAMPQQGQGGGQQMTPEERQKQRTELEAKVKAILKPEQSQRLREIQLQMQGPRALAQPEIAKELGLSADQIKKIEAALQVARPQGAPGGGAPGAGAGPGAGPGGGRTPGAGPGGPGGFDREAFMKAREEANKKAIAVLTPAQKAQWEKMQGKKFELQMPQGSRGGGGSAVPK